MKRFDERTFDYEKNLGKVLNCVEIVNLKDAISLLVFYYENEKEAERECKELNETNQDKKFEYRTINYLVEIDKLISI